MRILIADDHTLFRDCLGGFMNAHGFEVVGKAGDGRETIDLTRRLKPDVVLMDLAMPGIDGLAATRQISAEMPQVKIVVLTASDDDTQLFESIRSGAQGYLQKNLDSREFLALLQGVDRGEPALTPDLSRKLLQEFARQARPAPPPRDPDALTERELEVLKLLVQGVTSSRKLAQRLNVNESTIKFHIRNILGKLHLQNRAQAVSYAIRHGMVPPP